MNSILRAQREARGELEPIAVVPDSLLPPLVPPRSPENRLTRVSSRSNHRAIEVAPLIYENPCQPCRPRLAPRSPRTTSMITKIRMYSPYLSMTCFIVILVWEVSHHASHKPPKNKSTLSFSLA